jgi:hypothetical protein
MARLHQKITTLDSIGTPDVAMVAKFFAIQFRDLASIAASPSTRNSEVGLIPEQHARKRGKKRGD